MNNLKQVYQYVVAHIHDGAYHIAGRELFIACPECGDESHFSVNISNGRYNCFKCPCGGRLSSVILSNRVQWKKLTQNLLSKDLLGSKSTGKIVLPKNAFVIYSVLYPSEPATARHIQNSLSLCERAFKYCLKRGLTKEQIRDYRVYVCPMDPRVYFPYWDGTGEIVYYMGRKMMGNQDIRTKDAENTEKPLFGRHVKVHRDVVSLVEGVFDHFVTPFSYAIMGSSINSTQILQLRDDEVKTVFVIGDPDAAITIMMVAQKLRNFRLNAFPVFVHMEGDPGDLGREKMELITEELLSKKRTIFQPIHVTCV